LPRGSDGEEEVLSYSAVEPRYTAQPLVSAR